MSTVGRPRTLTDAQVAEILQWHERVRTLLALIKSERERTPTLRTFAKQLGTSPAAITRAVRQRGQFKQVTPEHRAEAIREYHAKLRELNKQRPRARGKARLTKGEW